VLYLSLLEFKNVSYISDNKAILKDFNLGTEPGDFISILGPSGSGKSTFLKMCSHLITPTKGEIFFREKNILEYNPMDLRKKIAYCFQTPYLFGDTVLDNLSFPYSIRDSKVNLKKIEEFLDAFSLDNEILHKNIKNLSGGEKQRIALIRTMLFKPDILLLDEVTSALDVDNTLIVENIIKNLNKQGITIMWVTHNPEQGRKYANKLLFVESSKIKALEVIR
jgi:putative ABC transport system ATP-binding protein